MPRSARSWLGAAALFACAWPLHAQETSPGWLLHNASVYERHGKWAEAGECYERVLALGWDVGHAGEDGFTVPAGDEVASRFSAWPEEAWQAYQAERGIAATARLQAAIAHGDLNAVLAVAQGSFATCAGARAVLFYARRECEAGRFASALEWTRRIVRLHPALRAGVSLPEPAPSRLEVLALAAHCERRLLGTHIQGEAAAEVKRFAPGEVVVIGDREVTAGELAASWRPDAAVVEEASRDPLSIAAAGGAQDVDGAGPTYARWTFPIREPDMNLPPNLMGLSGPLGPCFLSVAPLIHQDVILFQDGSRLFCLDLGQGRLRWQFPPRDRVARPKREQRYLMDETDEIPSTVAVYRGTAVTMLCLHTEEGELCSKSRFEDPYSLDLVAVDVDTGRKAWSSLDWADPALEGLGFACNPVLRDGVLYAFASALRGKEDIARFSLAIEVESGRVRWCIALPDPASTQDPGPELTRLVGHCARVDEHGGRLYILTNDGLCACLDRKDGSILWRSSLETPDHTIWSQSYRTESLFAGPSSFAMVGTTILVLPFGGGPLHALDASTGKERWSFWGDHAFLVGVSEGRAVLAGESLTCLDVAGRKCLWTYPLQGMLSGRPAISGTEVFVPLLEGIAAVDIASGPKADPALPGNLPLLAEFRAHGLEWQWRGTGGQLAVSEGRLVATSTEGVHAWATRKGIEAEAAERIARDPRDAEAWALRADMAWAVGERAKACDDYEQAARVIDGSEKGARGKLRKRALDRVYTIASEVGRKALAAIPADYEAARKSYQRALDAVDTPDQSRNCVLALLTAAHGLRDTPAMVDLLERLQRDYAWNVVPWGSHVLTREWDQDEQSPSVKSCQPSIWALARERLLEVGSERSDQASRALAAREREGASERMRGFASVAATWPETPAADQARQRVVDQLSASGNEELASALLGNPTAQGDSSGEWRELRLIRTLPAASPWAVEGDRAFGIQGGQVVAWDLGSGEERWRAAGTPRDLVVVAGRVLAIGETIRALDAATAKVAWEADGAPKVEIVSGLVFATSESKMRALDASTGCVLWEHAIGKANAYASVAWVDTRPVGDRMLLWASGPVRALDLLTGMPLYQVHASQPRPGLNLAVVGDADGVLAYAEEGENVVVGVSRRDGRPRWRTPLPLAAGSVRLLSSSPDGEAILVGGEDGRLRVLAPHDGQVKHSFSFDCETWLPLGCTAERLPLRDGGEVLVVASRAGRTVSLVGWDMASGGTRWGVPVREGIVIGTLAREAAIAETADVFAVAQELVDAGRRQVCVLCLSKLNGAVLLRDEALFIAQRPSVALAEGRLLLPTADGLRVYGPAK